MANTHIRAVLFDMGGTLEDLYSDEGIRVEAMRGLRALLRQRELDPGLSLPDLRAAVMAGLEAYQAWKEERESELPPERVCSEFAFAGLGLPPERLAAAAEELMFFYESQFHIRKLRPEVPETLDALQGKGLELAIISNVTSHGLVPAMLAKYGISRYFDVVVTSSGLGWRKPNPRIFLEATRQLGVPPAACAYVGDTVSRDVIGARRAGFGLAIQIRSFLTTRADRDTEPMLPDAVIQDLRQVVGLVTQSSELIHDH